jgi:hypothetical protein
LHFCGVLDPGSAVRLTLQLDEQATLTFAGRVAWVDRAFRPGDGTAGVAFREELDRTLVAGIEAALAPPWGPPLDVADDES